MTALPLIAHHSTPPSFRSIPIIDTHVHFWELDRLEYPWLENRESPLSRDFTPEDYQQATREYQLKKVVFVESGRSPDQYLPETKWVSELSARYPFISGMVAYFSIDKGEAVNAEWEELISYPLVKGIRFTNSHAESIHSPAYHEGIRMLTKANLSLDWHIDSSSVSQYLPVVDRYPDTVFVLNHLGLPDVKNGELKVWKEALASMAERPNVYCKLSGLLTRASAEQRTKAALEPYIRYPLECFGTERVLFGSDWPVVTLADTFAEWMRMLEAGLGDLSSSELHQIFYENAERAYRL